ncbi:MAG: hypothetical protein LQ338_005449 [Usnochroma carphineum]|nr:MAG: hypothetical protein LQ338_005449 [Usnochroma carphineum]
MFYGETQTVGWRSWVLVIDADYVKNGDELTSDRVRLAVDLWTQADVVVRNDRRYICFMSPTGQSVNGRHREWVCKVWDLDDRDSRPMTLQIPDLAVGEIGQTLVFEIFNGYLYAVSTQSPFELDEPGWTSDYTCLRFPLENPHPLTLEKLQIWRRHHNEGPINDLWTDLKLHADEATGKLFIVEARKEWTFGSSVQRRTWHRQALPPLFPFPKDATDNDDQKMANVGNQDANQHQLTAANQPHDLMSSNTSVHDPPYLLVKPPGDDEPDQGLDSAALLNFGLRPGHPRLPHDTHSEYPADAPVPPIVDSFLLANSKYRTYEPSAAAFLDLVVDDRRKPSRQSNWAQQIRLRIGSRRKAPPLNENGMIHEHLINSYSGQPVPDSELRYVDQGIHLWPPVDAPIVLQDLLNGNSQIPTNDMTSNESGYRTLGEITAISDERSIIYLVKKRDASENDQGQLILINFDEHIRFFYKKWVPRFLDLYRHQSLDPQPTEPITIERLLEKEYERIEVDSDELDQGDDEDQEAEEEISDREGEGTIIPADDINDYHWQELYDEDEEPEWIIEEMASWTELRQGFRFV